MSALRVPTNFLTLPPLNVASTGGTQSTQQKATAPVAAKLAATQEAAAPVKRDFSDAP